MRLNRVRVPRPNLDLIGLTYTSDRDVKPICVVLSHGYTASKESLDVLASYLSQRGYPCLTFDCRGHKLGATGGRLDNLEDALDDLIAAAIWAMRHFEVTRVVLAGHSMGGILSIAAAGKMDNAAGVCAIAVSPSPSAAFHSTAGKAMLAQRADYVDGMDPNALLQQLGTLAHSVKDIQHLPSMFVAARGDILVNADHLKEFAHQAGPLSEVAEIDSSHLEAPYRARGAVANWIDRVQLTLS